MTNLISHWKRGMMSAVPRTTASAIPGRCTISGKNILDENGQPFIIRGFNQGHGELTENQDPIEDVAMGANTVRIIWRVWGDYGDNNGVIQDGQDLNNPSRFKTDYLEGIADRVVRAKAAGLKVDLVGDSNCGQGIQGAGCIIDGLDNQDFWTDLGKLTQRQYFLQAWRWMTRRLYGLVDFYEPLVEPGSPNADQASTTAFNKEIMQVILKEDPAALFVIGGYPNYESQHTSDGYDSAWVGNNQIILTCNMLDGLVTNTETLPSKIAFVTGARSTLNVPVMINQLGTNTSSDPSDTFLDNVFTLLDTASGGSIGYLIWEKIAVFSTSYGMYTQATIGAPRVLKANRKAVIQSHFNAAKVAAT